MLIYIASSTASYLLNLYQWEKVESWKKTETSRENKHFGKLLNSRRKLDEKCKPYED